MSTIDILSGITWYANDYFDASTGLLHHFDPDVSGATVSPNGGTTWYDSYSLSAAGEYIACQKSNNDSSIVEIAKSTDHGVTWEYETNELVWYSDDEYIRELESRIDYAKYCLENGEVYYTTNDGVDVYLTEETAAQAIEEIEQMITEYRENHIYVDVNNQVQMGIPDEDYDRMMGNKD